MFYLYKDIVFDKNAPKLAGYTSSMKKIRCEIVSREGDEVLVKVKKTKWRPAGIFRVMGYEVVE